jgi:hypothetical protein
LSVLKRLDIQVEHYAESVEQFSGLKDVKGTVHLKLRFKTNKDKVIQTCLKFYVMELDGKVDAVFGADFLFGTKEIDSLNLNCLT